MSTTIPTSEQYDAKFLRKGVSERVARLHDLVDQIEREAESNIQRAEAGQGTYGQVVSDITHGLAWGIANLNMATLIRVATDADIAHAKGE